MVVQRREGASSPLLQQHIRPAQKRPRSIPKQSSICRALFLRETAAATLHPQGKWPQPRSVHTEGGSSGRGSIPEGNGSGRRSIPKGRISSHGSAPEESDSSHGSVPKRSNGSRGSDPKRSGSSCGSVPKG